MRQAARPADRQHPFGYGQARYFWSLLAAFGIFVAGAGFSVFEGVLSLHSHTSNFLLAYIVLGLSAVAEGTSFLRVSSQLRREARQSRAELLEHVRTSRDTTVKAAVFEDSAALAGLALAAAGCSWSSWPAPRCTAVPPPFAISVLLVVVAVQPGLDSRNLLFGEAADPRVQRVIREEIERTPGRGRPAAAADHARRPGQRHRRRRVALSGDSTADQVEDLADDIDQRLAERLPVTPYVFIDPIQARSGQDRLTPPGRRHPAG